MKEISNIKSFTDILEGYPDKGELSSARVKDPIAWACEKGYKIT